MPPKRLAKRSDAVAPTSNLPMALETSAPWPATSKVDASLAKAQGAAAMSLHPTAIKVMTPSTLASGELHLPVSFTSSLSQDPGQQPITLWGDVIDEGHTVMWAPQTRNGGRFTAGWRGFVNAHKLAIGDVALFERLSRASIRVTVFRASAAEGPQGAVSSSSSSGGQNSRKRPLKPQEAAVAVPPKKPRRNAQEPKKVVESIVTHRLGPTGHTEYLTLWVGCLETTWEPRASFVNGRTTADALRRYELLHPQQVRAPEPEYDVEAILGHRTSPLTGEMEYHTAWKGYPTQTWEPRSCFVLGDVITEALLRYEEQLQAPANSQGSSFASQKRLLSGARGPRR